MPYWQDQYKKATGAAKQDLYNRFGQRYGWQKPQGNPTGGIVSPMPQRQAPMPQIPGKPTNKPMPQMQGQIRDMMYRYPNNEANTQQQNWQQAAPQMGNQMRQMMQPVGNDYAQPMQQAWGAAKGAANPQVAQLMAAYQKGLNRGY